MPIVDAEGRRNRLRTNVSVFVAKVRLNWVWAISVLVLQYRQQLPQRDKPV
jgi:hypothetical protein